MRRSRIRSAGAALVSAFGYGCVIPLSTTQGDAGGPSTRDGGGLSEGGASDGSRPVIPTGPWINVTGVLAGTPSVCGSIASMSSKPGEDSVLVGVARVGLWESSGGGPWTQLGTGADSAMFLTDLSSIVYDPLASARYWATGQHGPGLFETKTNGNTFIQLGTFGSCDMVSVDLTDPERKTLLVGGHEVVRTVYRSTDSGVTWQNIGGGLPDKSYCTLPVFIDPLTYLVGCAGYPGGPSGVFRTIDGALTFQQVSKSGGGSQPLLASDGSFYWMSISGGGMSRSTDNGQSWHDVVGPGVLTSKSPVELADKRLAALGAQYVMVSSDHGSTWAPATSQLPPNMMENVDGFIYSPQRNAFFIWQNLCPNGPQPVTSDAIMRYDLP